MVSDMMPAAVAALMFVLCTATESSCPSQRTASDLYLAQLKQRLERGDFPVEDWPSEGLHRLDSTAFLEETSEMTTSHFSVFDRNADDTVDREEAMLHGSEHEWRNSLDKFDEDRDQVLSRTEFEKLLLERSSFLEVSSDNVSHAADHGPAGCQHDDLDEAGADRGAAALAAQQHVALETRQRHVQAEAKRIGAWWRRKGATSHVRALQQLFGEADVDQSGELDLQEYESAGTIARYQHVQGPFLEALDLDANSLVSDSEATAGAAFEFGLLDGDQDGALDWTEVKGKLAQHSSRLWLALPHALAAERTLPGWVAAWVELQLSAEEEAPGLVPASGPSSEATHAPEHVDDAGLEAAEEAASAWNVSLVALLQAPGRRRRHRKKLSAEEAQELAALVGSKTLATMTELLSQEFCWRKSYDRGVGKPARCGRNYETRGAMCYKKCSSGWHRSNGDIEFCQKTCSSGSTDIGLHCRTNGKTKSKSCCGRCWPKRWCCRTACCGGCSKGYTNTGCFCEPSWVKQDRSYSPGKTKYSRSVVGCTDPKYPDGPKQTPLGYFCYPKPRNGYSCDLTACRENCPTLLQSCGLGACAASRAGCSGQIFKMSFDTAMAVVDTALLVASWGTTSGGAAQGKRVAVSKSTQSTFRQAAKANLKNFQRRLQQGATKRAIKKVVAERLTKEAMKQVLKATLVDLGIGLVDAAVDAAIGEILVKQGKDLDQFDFTSLDPTGISGAVKGSVDGESALSQAQAWTEVVSVVDPTGWVAAAASFMHPTCG